MYFSSQSIFHTCTYRLPHFLSDILAALWGHWEALNGAGSFEMDLNTHLTAKTVFSKPFGVWDCHVNVPVVVVVGWIVVLVVLDLVNVVSIVTTALMFLRLKWGTSTCLKHFYCIPSLYEVVVHWHIHSWPYVSRC